MKTFESKKVRFIGDTHGLFNYVERVCAVTRDTVLIHVGDFGLGFIPLEREKLALEKINNELVFGRNTLIVIRGNHDSKILFDFFRGQFSNIYFPEEYEVCKINEHTYQFIGGAVSIDRLARKQGRDYWSDEGVVQDLTKCQKVDVLVTHSAPSYCYPVGLNDFVLSWCKADPTLASELSDERKYLDKVFEICQPSLHFYGHFHNSKKEPHNNCIHRLLDINETYDL